MTKQPHSATKLRLSKLFRWLAVLCFMKLTILGMLLLDVNRGKLAAVDDRDLTAVLALLHDQERQPLDDDNWAHWLAGASSLFMTYRPPQPHLPVQLATLSSLHEQFRLQVQPEPEVE